MRRYSEFLSLINKQKQKCRTSYKSRWTVSADLIVGGRVCVPACVNGGLVRFVMTHVTLLDAGFSSQLTHHVGDIADGDPLWTSRFLQTNPDAVVQTHLDFLKAGAEIISTNSYQASISGFMRYLGCSEAASYNLIKKSVKLAVEARDMYLEANADAKRPLIAGSVGPYGASLHDGSEYTGAYLSNTTRNTIEAWQRPRIMAMVEEGVDLLAIETIPALEEAELLLKILKDYPKQKAWLSFQCKDEKYTARGDKFKEAIKKIWSLNNAQLVAVGCNCIDPMNVSGLIGGLNKGVEEKIPLIVYPNSGEEYTPTKGWCGVKKCSEMTVFIKDWLNMGVQYLGGCCRMDVADLLVIKKAMQDWMANNTKPSSANH